jgi:hypothetical protein
MEIEFMIIADSAEAINGKLYMLGGGWDQHRSSAYPSQIRMGIAVSILVAWEETNQKHAVRINVADSEGNAILPEVEASMELGRPPGIAPGSKQRAMFAVNAAFPLPRPGSYVVTAAAGPCRKQVRFEALLSGTLLTSQLPPSSRN